MNALTAFVRSIGPRIALAAAVSLALGTLPAFAAGDDPVPAPKPTSSPGLAATAALLTNEGIARSNLGDWQGAEERYRAALRADRQIPEAWNGLGHALKMQRRYDAALLAYDEALKLRPSYPKALEYLGETYVAMGRLDDARKVLARLEKLDGQLAVRLANAIQGETSQTASW